jgi:hypothetical protein
MAEQRFYDQVAREIASQQLDRGLWVRAFSEMRGDEAKAKAAYIALRVAQLEAEQRAAEALAKERMARARRRADDEVIKRKREVEGNPTPSPPPKIPDWLGDGFRPLHKDPVILAAIILLLLALLLSGVAGVG